MRIIRSVSEIQEWSSAERRAGKSIGFVPTMGALHLGHAELFRRSVAENQRTVVSIFVNSLQFNNASDLEAYPRQLEQDLLIAERENIDVLFVPNPEEMYPEGFSSIISVGSIAKNMEGLHRPGHFDGVATVVVKLLNAVAPTGSYFGEKDFQQVAVIRQVVRDLNISCEIVSVPTVRDEYGLALSSRNARLTPDQLAQAPQIYVLLDEITKMSRTTKMSSRTIQEHFTNGIESSTAGTVEYIEIVDSLTLNPIATTYEGTTICVAVWFDDVRLIDNVSI
ncbi:MAG: pantoate--beta-alanine ligase [Actinobacteria bacterium]|nr:pantoate--beta-alanine ligase [Actinomycetota bacterium]